MSVAAFCPEPGPGPSMAVGGGFELMYELADDEGKFHVIASKGDVTNGWEVDGVVLQNMVGVFTLYAYVICLQLPPIL
jgi:hypothetical protein